MLKPVDFIAEQTDEVKDLLERINELEQKLRLEQNKYQMIADYSDIGLWEYDIKHKRMTQTSKSNQASQQEDGVIENYYQTVRSWGVIHPEDVKKFELFCKDMDNGESKVSCEIRVVADDIQFTWFRYNGIAEVDECGKPYKIIGKTMDITKEKRDQEDLLKQAMIDSLTHLYNKAATKKIVQKLISNSSKGKKAGMMMIIDIDNFKNINDRWGHLYGDNVLERFSNILLTNFESDDIVGRIGGDEFIVYCPNITTLKAAKERAELILLRGGSVNLKEEVFLTISIGIAMFPKDAITYDALYKSADIALYDAKRRGKNGYAVYSKKRIYSAAVGETTRKQSENEFVQILPKNMTDIEKDIFDYAFEVINMNENFFEAVNSIFSEMGIYFGLDRILMVEHNFAIPKAKVLQEWSKEEDTSSIVELENIYTRHWVTIQERFVNDWIYSYSCLEESNSIIHKTKEFLSRDIKSFVQFPIFDGTQLVGIVTFENCHENHEWTKNETTTFASITKMIACYFLRNRVQLELEDEILYTGSAMDNQKLTYYSVDAINYEIRYISRYATELFPNIKIGYKCYQAIMGRNAPCSNCPVKGLDRQHTHYSTEVYSEHYDSWFTVSASKIDKKKKPEYLLCWTDVTTFLERVKSTDQLTGTLSYDKFRAEALKRLAYRDKRYSIVSLGIKDFTRINDKFGYEIGDYVLRATARKFVDSLYEEELICRIKGDDFILLLGDNGITSVKERVTLICGALRVLIRSKYAKININCVAGIYEIKPTDYSISTIMDKANLAKRLTTRTYSNQSSVLVLTEDIEKQETEEREIEQTMVEALRDGEFKVYLQPKVGVQDNQICGAEALVRWQKPDGSYIPPYKFIPIAERNGFVKEIDKFVYETLFWQMRLWLNAKKKVPIISVNVSRLHLFDDHFLDYMKMIIDKYNIPRNLIEIEITESVFFDNIDRLIEMISRLREFGFLISMDDFGNGYSTLNLMKSLPIDILKIDGCFFMKNELDEKSRAVIASIIHLAKNLKLQVVAEGIETKEQLEFIKHEECDIAQGYLYYTPMSMGEFSNLMEPNGIE